MDSREEPVDDAACEAGVLDMAFRGSPYGILYHDASSRVVACNEAAERILRIPSKESLGKDAFDPEWRSLRIDGTPLPIEEHPLSVCLRTGKPVLGAIAGIWDVVEGRPRWLRVDAFPRFNGGELAGVVVWIDDVTEDIEISRAEKRSRDRFMSLFDHMSEGVALHETVFDGLGRPIDYRIIDVNPRYEAHVGIPREAAVGHLGSEVYGTSPAPYLEEFCGVALTGKPHRFETYFAPLDKHFLISIAPLGPGGFATIFFDISESKRAQSERERLLSELERKNKEMESIVYVASHDLRSPLVNIQGFGARLERDSARLARDAEAASAGDAAAAAEARELALSSIPRSLEFVRAGAAKIDALISGLLRLSRIGRAAISSRELDMEEMLGQIVKAMSFQIESAGARVDIGSLPPCSGDPDQISQVFSNLLDNAIKYRSPDRPLVVAVTGRARGRCSEYSVADNGIGMPPDRVDRAFEIFCRLEPDDGIEGEGLGLTLARQIVERHGGSMRVESELGAGSRFVVLLPGKESAGEDCRCQDD